MDKSDLLQMLDLDGRDPAPAKGALSFRDMPAKAATPRKSLEPHAVQDIDQWGLRRGEDILRRNHEMQIALGGMTKQAVETAADFHAAVFEPDPKLNEACFDPMRLAFLQQLMETAEFKSLRAGTELDSVASEIAAVDLAKRFGPLRSRDVDEMELMRQVYGAIEEAEADVEEMKEACRACGIGIGPCNSDGNTEEEAIASLYRRVRSNPTLRRICELAGRFRRLAQSKQRQKVNHGFDDLVGVTTRGDIGRLLPVELAKLADPDFELDALRRLVERQMMIREYQGVEKVAKGPIMVCVDESSSMDGEKIHTAKALSLSMAWIARHQRRWACLVGWSSCNQRRVLVLPPDRWDENALCDWLSRSFSGGTEPPLLEMPQIYAQTKAPVGRTDILMITDGSCSLDDDVPRLFTEWKKKAHVRMTTLIVQCGESGMECVSDEVHYLDRIDTSEEAIQKVVSI